MATVAEDILHFLKSTNNEERAKHSLRFFRTGPGEYGEGDRFFGQSVPEQRRIANQFWKEASLDDVVALLQEPWHEARLVALFILVKKYSKALAVKQRDEIFHYYINNLNRVNNWDLVDSSAPYISGPYLAEHPELLSTIWKKWLSSDNIWERRVAVLSTFPFIKLRKYDPILLAAKYLLTDPHDLIHKAVGWMLREVGKRDERVLREFLLQHSQSMPRTMLRYAIEKFDTSERSKWLKRARPFELTRSND